MSKYTHCHLPAWNGRGNFISEHTYQDVVHEIMKYAKKNQWRILQDHAGMYSNHVFFVFFTCFYVYSFSPRSLLNSSNQTVALLHSTLHLADSLEH